MISVEHVQSSSYVDLIALLRESNRPPGGMDTIRRLINFTHLRPGTRVLHAGCNAGFLSRELARRTGAHGIGIDINAEMIRAARTRAAEDGLSDLLTYQQADMRTLPFEDDTFDVVLSGGALAFVDGGHPGSIAEWERVVRPHGLLADAELFYHSPPPQGLLDEVSATIGVRVPVYDLAYWQGLFDTPNLEPYALHVSPPCLSRGPAAIETYVNGLVEQLSDEVDIDAREPLCARLRETFELFDRNMAYLSYVIIVRTWRPDGFEPSLYS